MALSTSCDGKPRSGAAADRPDDVSLLERRAYAWKEGGDWYRAAVDCSRVLEVDRREKLPPAVAGAWAASAGPHGPWLAALGLVGSYVTPFLVSSTAPNPWALATYLLVVTAAAFALARLRLWILEIAE